MGETESQVVPVVFGGDCLSYEFLKGVSVNYPSLNYTKNLPDSADRDILSDSRHSSRCPREIGW